MSRVHHLLVNGELHSGKWSPDARMRDVADKYRLDHDSLKDRGGLEIDKNVLLAQEVSDTSLERPYVVTGEPTGAPQQDEKSPYSEEVQAGVSRLMHGEECVGTACLILPDIVMTARHCITEGTSPLDVKAFGQKLDFVGASPRHDLAFFRLTKSSLPAYLKIASPYWQPGSAVYFLGYPRAVDEGQTSLLNVPLKSKGKIVKVYESAHLVAADYHGGMPNASGSALLNRQGQLVGVHVGTEYHREQTEGFQIMTCEVGPDKIEVKGDDLWSPPSPIAPDSTDEGDSSGTVENISGRLSVLTVQVKQALANVEHKEHLSLYVPSNTILDVMHGIQALGFPEADTAAHRGISAQGLKRKLERRRS